MNPSSLSNGDIVLVRFPFTDLSGSKLRPAVIISSNSVHQTMGDYTLLFISSVIPPSLALHELSFLEDHPDFKKSGLKKSSVFKTSKLATIQKKLIRKKLGTIGDVIRKELAEKFGKAVAL